MVWFQLGSQRGQSRSVLATRDVEFDPAVGGTTLARAIRIDGLFFTIALGLQTGLRHAIANQVLANGLRPTLAQPLV